MAAKMVLLSTEGHPQPPLLLLLLLFRADVLQHAEDFLELLVTSTELWQGNASIGTASELEIR